MVTRHDDEVGHRKADSTLRSPLAPGAGLVQASGQLVQRSRNRSAEHGRNTQSLPWPEPRTQPDLS